MRLILARHGNTFNPGDKIVWVGKTNDLPLVAEGILQAERMGRALRSVPLAAVYCAPLKRTRQFAETVLSAAQQAIVPVIDDRLTELDYGGWSGLSDQEIADKFGSQCLKDWASGEWPQDCGWAGSAENVVAELQAFINDVIANHSPESNVLVVSSNGRLRYFFRLVEGEYERRAQQGLLKTGTGKAGVLVIEHDRMRFPLWNEAPDTLSAMFVAGAR